MKRGNILLFFLVVLFLIYNIQFLSSQDFCPEYYEPVCGIDGETYSNTCYANQAGVETDCEGECPCQEETGYCGDGTCQNTEDCSSCELDCGVCAPYCGDLICNEERSCIKDCSTMSVCFYEGTDREAAEAIVREYASSFSFFTWIEAFNCGYGTMNRYPPKQVEQAEDYLENDARIRGSQYGPGVTSSLMSSRSLTPDNKGEIALMSMRYAINSSNTMPYGYKGSSLYRTEWEKGGVLELFDSTFCFWYVFYPEGEKFVISMAKQGEVIEGYQREGNVHTGEEMELVESPEPIPNREIISTGYITDFCMEPFGYDDEELEELFSCMECEVLDECSFFECVQGAGISSKSESQILAEEKVCNSPGTLLVKGGTDEICIPSEILGIEIKDTGLFKETDEGKKEVISPSEALRQSEIDVLEDIELREEQDKLIYEIKGTKRKRLFFIIPVNLKIESKINAETGEILEIKKPWWSFLVW